MAQATPTDLGLNFFVKIDKIQRKIVLSMQKEGSGVDFQPLLLPHSPSVHVQTQVYRFRPKT